MDKLFPYYQEIEDCIDMTTRLDSIFDTMPLSFQINLLNKCFQKCIGCAKPTWPDVELTLKKTQDILQWLAINGGKSVVFSGGEPLLYNDFNEVIKIAVDNELEVGILTSALWKSTLNVEEVVANSNYIAVSLDGASDEVYAKTRGVDCLPQIIQNMRKISVIKRERQLKVRLKVHATISKYNVHEMADILRLAENLYFDECNFFPIHTYEELKVDAKYVNDIYENMIKTSKSGVHIKTNVMSFMSMTKRTKPPLCIMPWIHAFIDANGDVFFCCRLADDNGSFENRDKSVVVGNVNEMNMEELWHGERAKDLRLRIYKANENVCKQCDRYNALNFNYSKWLNIEDEKQKEIFL